MARKSKGWPKGWPQVGQLPKDSKTDPVLIKEDADKLLEYGKPSGDCTDGKQCPYQTIESFCKTVIAYLDTVPAPPTSAAEPILTTLQSSGPDPENEDLKNEQNPKVARVDTYGVLVV
ncbi:hypothetical protein ABVK25_009266 [Lepraria finkii]|uniref:Prolactin receptor n=1 Tax=Lepraria finkii TaxID=1340010 RepID=A0ABR4AZP3_9LECA